MQKLRIGFRTDANALIGTGHAMRSLTLAKSLAKFNTEITFYSSIPSDSWLQNQFKNSNFEVRATEINSFDVEYFLNENLDLLVIDSYFISSEFLNAYSNSRNLAAIIDGDARGISAHIYIDQNIGAKKPKIPAKIIGAEFLLGSSFSLIRQEVLDEIKTFVETPIDIKNCTLLCLSGGSDPSKTLTKMAEIVSTIPELHSIFVAPQNQHKDISKILNGSDHSVINFTSDLPKYISSSTSVFTAAGSTAWDIMTIKIPSLYTAVAENQIESLENIEKFKVGNSVGIESELLSNVDLVREELLTILLNRQIRIEIFQNCKDNFDGKGSERVAKKIVELIS